MPMRSTIRLPISSTALRSSGNAEISDPMPKNAPSVSDMSKTKTHEATISACARGRLIAELMTNRFCTPMGAIDARAIISP